MRSVTYSMGVSLDGYIVGPDGHFGWTAPDVEVFRFVTDEIRQVGVHLLGRRLYETMLYWETADQDPSLDDSMLEWAAIWKALPKVVFSATLSAVQGNARLASGGLAEEVERLRAEPGEGDIAIGGSTLAAEAAALGLIDEYRARVYPVLVGGGIPFFPERERRVDLNSSRCAPSARESSTSTTAWRASRLVRRVPEKRASQWLDLNPRPVLAASARAISVAVAPQALLGGATETSVSVGRSTPRPCSKAAERGAGHPRTRAARRLRHSV
jgi:dihydrofolate reductase